MIWLALGALVLVTLVLGGAALLGRVARSRMGRS